MPWRHIAPRLPRLQGGRHLAHAGMETDLIFTRGVDLPGFASCPLPDTDDGRRLLRGHFRDLIAVARAHRAGAIPESPTRVANRDRGAARAIRLHIRARQHGGRSR